MIEAKTERGEALELTRDRALEELRKLKEIEDPDKRDRAAFVMSMRIRFPVLLDVLHELITYNEMATIAGVESSRSVRNWATGVRRPHSRSVEASLRLAFRISALLYDSDNPRKVRNWLKTTNKFLRDERPIEALKRRDLLGAPSHGREVLEAAKHA